ncbi:hypothetical protein L207DRAFT_523334 [Hyaloscypha variabilis F]|uniref:Uncharacterized protein n=1 Tax=Hyaloscypha variabilis (strain UAMH 11265 / GT02V1 / F) TaxID=1149755 RepID=A0A2J6SB65_HYAVF|nr:hypothetical protein L207DRAFT_523334 [Hyaloscypha variabilis F]
MVFYWGTSEWPADEITEACGIAKELRMVAAVAEQPLYNIFLIIRNSRESFKDFIRAASSFSESKDKFAKFMRENYGNKEWKENVSEVAKLKNDNGSSVITGASRSEQIVVNIKSSGLLKSVTSKTMDDIGQVMSNTLAQDPARQD